MVRTESHSGRVKRGTSTTSLTASPRYTLAVGTVVDKLIAYLAGRFLHTFAMSQTVKLRKHAQLSRFILSLAVLDWNVEERSGLFTIAFPFETTHQTHLCTECERSRLRWPNKSVNQCICSFQLIPKACYWGQYQRQFRARGFRSCSEEELHSYFSLSLDAAPCDPKG